MTTAVTPAAQFPVEYFQEHVVEETRPRLVLLTGLSQGTPATEIADAYLEVIRKQLGRGQHISQVLVWNPDPPEFDFPTKKQAELMDALIQREHNTIPIEVHEVREEPDGITIVYRVRVTEEQLLEEEERDRLGPGPDPGEAQKPAAVPTGPFLVGAALSGGFGYLVMPKTGPAGTRVLVVATLALLGGATAVAAAKKKQEGQQLF